MDEVYTTRALLSTIREGLLDIGYREDLLLELPPIFNFSDAETVLLINC